VRIDPSDPSDRIIATPSALRSPPSPNLYIHQLCPVTSTPPLGRPSGVWLCVCIHHAFAARLAATDPGRRRRLGLAVRCPRNRETSSLNGRRRRGCSCQEAGVGVRRQEEEPGDVHRGARVRDRRRRRRAAGL